MSLHKTFITISSITLFSRITGLFREILFARVFGASIYTDAFNIAFRIPNLLRRLFAEGAFSQAFVPILTEYKNKRGNIATKKLIDHVATVLIWFMFFICVFGIIMAPIIVYLVATGFIDNYKIFNITVSLTRIMFPYVGFMAFITLASSILNIWSQFKIPAFTPILLNISCISILLLISFFIKQSIYFMAFAVVLGGALQIIIQIPSLIKIGMFPHIKLNPSHGFKNIAVRRILKKMGPSVFSVFAAQISLMLNTNIVSQMREGSLSCLSYADRLMEFPTTLLGVTFNTILLPNLSKARIENNTEEYSAILDWSLRLTFLLAAPCAIILITLSLALTATIFHYGKFNAESVIMTSNALIAYGIGLIGLVMVKILTPCFYAIQEIKIPIITMISILIIIQLINYLLVPIFAHSGLALSIGLGACLHASFLYWYLRHKRIYIPCAGWGVFFIRLVIALLLLVIVALWGNSYFNWLGMQAHPIFRIVALLLILLFCGITYFLALRIMGFRFKEFKYSKNLI
ncbi:murein biosynthesis integral membrane protein MurJ [Candidatus Profftella armatura]|uniref:murein biosynthesis integral membrane protein MurJ n=1 Tax=Candidatus Profftella armatura TaxID=669502 RepID=UPI003D95C6BB